MFKLILILLCKGKLVKEWGLGLSWVYLDETKPKEKIPKLDHEILKFNNERAKKEITVNTPVVVRVNKDRHVKRGQGEGETNWNGWAWKVLLVMFVIFFYLIKNC